MTLLKPFSTEFQEDPHATYHRLRAQEPVHAASLFGVRFWVLTRYRDVAAALRDPRLSAQASASHLMPRELREGNLFFMDPPEHGRLRSLINKAFLPSVVEALRPQLAELVEETLDAALASERLRGHFDIVGDLSAALSLRTSMQLMGLPPSDGARVRHWTEALTVLLDATQLLPRLPAAYAAAREVDAYVRSVIALRRSAPDARRPRDLLDALITACDERVALSEQELTATSTFMMVAGHETMTSVLGTGLLALLTRPEEWQRLRADPGLIPSAFEEMLRFEPPAQLMTKTAREDLDIGGSQIRKGEAVVAVMAAANRDPEHFAEPDRFDVGRADNRHLSFGLGPHFCVGAGLARLQGQLLLEGLLRRMPGLSIDPRRAVRRPGIVLRALAALPASSRPAHSVQGLRGAC